ncbi:MAG: hypothetical protein ACJ0F6_00095 [Acidimicrobiales bacterium]
MIGKLEKFQAALGVEAEAEIVDSKLNLFELARTAFEASGLDAIVCDEAQFYEPKQIEQLAQVVDELHVDVYAFWPTHELSRRVVPRYSSTA